MNWYAGIYVSRVFRGMAAGVGVGVGEIDWDGVGVGVGLAPSAGRRNSEQATKEPCVITYNNTCGTQRPKVEMHLALSLRLSSLSPSPLHARSEPAGARLPSAGLVVPMPCRSERRHQRNRRWLFAWCIVRLFAWCIVRLDLSALRLFT